MSVPEIKSISLDNLILDPNNYRLVNEKNFQEVSKDVFLDEIVQKRIQTMLCGPRNENIRDLIDSFRSNGFLPVDQIQVTPIGNGKDFLVLEGNRRTACLKYLKSAFEKESIDLGALDNALFDSVPVVVYPNVEDVKQQLIVMGLKHISGNKKWGEWNQAQFMRRLYKEANDENKVCEAIGIDKTSLRRNLRALDFIEQYRESDYGDQFSESLFPVFREITVSTTMKNWLDWNDYTHRAENENRVTLLFSLISKEIEYVGDEGEEKIVRPPAITKRDEIRTLAKFVDDEHAMKVLGEQRNLAEAYNISKAGTQERMLQPISETIGRLEGEVLSLKSFKLSEKDASDVQKQINALQTYLDKSKAEGSIKDFNVFYNKISSHFSEITVENYKQFSDVRLDNCKRINIFAGDNNVGKTSLLESIFLLSYQNSFRGVQEIIRRRAKIADNKVDAKWFGNQILSDASVKGVFDGFPCSVEIKSRNEDVQEIEDSTGYLKSISLKSVFGRTEQDALIRLFENKEHSTVAKGDKVVCPIVFSSPFFSNEPHRYSSFYAKSVQAKTIEKIIGFIKENIIPTIKDIRLVDELQRFWVVDDAFDTARDLGSYGEGVQRIFFISLLFASVENGVVLIDEFENAIHFSLLEKFSYFVDKLSKEFNVQVFLTSHSKECIDAFASSVNDWNDVCYTTIVKSEKGVNVKTHSGLNFKRLLKISDMDLRETK